MLHSFKYGESKIIVDMFTREVGRLSFVVPLPKSPKSKVKKQYFQPMTLLEIECEIRQTVQLQKLKDARLLSAYTTIPYSPEKMALSLFVQNVPLFIYLCDSMQWLDTVEVGFANFHLTFLMRLSRFLGFYPNLDDYVDGCVFDMRAATFSLQVPTHRDFLQPEDARRIHTLMRMDFPTMHLYRLNHHDRNRIVASGIMEQLIINDKIHKI